MRRISGIHTDREVDLERRREQLRNIRWNRRRSKLVTTVWLALVLIVVLTPAHENVVRAVLHILKALGAVSAP
jgi:hypothetical protein